MIRHVLLSLMAAGFLSFPGEVRAQPSGTEAPKSKAPASPADDLVQRAAAAANSDNYTDALDLMRQAYRLEPSPRWLYDMAVLHDHLNECDDAAFFYRAATWGKGVLPQDRDAVESRLSALEEQCHYKKRHATAGDRHQRAGRYLALKFCTLARAILTGIASPAEKAQLDQCQPGEGK